MAFQAIQELEPSNNKSTRCSGSLAQEQNVHRYYAARVAREQSPTTKISADSRASQRARKHRWRNRDRRRPAYPGFSQACPGYGEVGGLLVQAG